MSLAVSLRPLLLVALLVAGHAGAQSAPASPTVPTSTAPRGSGDPWVDGRLADISSYAATYRDAFVDELVRYRRVPRELVLELLARPGWTPGDVYFACSLAVQAGRPCRAVADARAVVPVRDWATLAGEFAIAPGSPAFHELKRAIVASYDRWARPIAVDADLARDFPGRPRLSTPEPRHEGAGTRRPTAEPTRHPPAG